MFGLDVLDKDGLGALVMFIEMVNEIYLKEEI